MRIALSLFFSLAYFALAQGQFVCFSDSTAIYVFPGTKLTPMTGQATFCSGPFEVIVGGKFLDVQARDSAGIYNCDMLVLDYEADQTYVLPLSYFPPFVADQFSGVHYCYVMDNDTAYLLGGYGYDLTKGYEITFPMMTIFSVKTLIDSVVQRKDYLGLFEVVSDERLAITQGTLLRLGQYFLVTDGQEITPMQDEFTDRLTVSTWDFRGQMRKFRLKNTEGYREVDEFQVCNTSKVFYQCMPPKWRAEPTHVRELDKNKK